MIHHAYLIVGLFEHARTHAYELHGIPKNDQYGNPDIQELTYSTVGIDDVRQLKVWSTQAPVGAGRRLFILNTHAVAHEAQNALLKLFEEPPKASSFVLIIPQLEHILPTLRSRCEIVVLHRDEHTDIALSFLRMSYADRLKEIALRIKNKDSAWTDTLLMSLESHFYATYSDTRRSVHEDALRALLFVQGYIGKRGASPKMLLEHLAVVLPSA
ncbi:hypothetical protein K2X96_01705 [Patescibacteria group bacterium]|nr:hypothetical protein [Patescibacteria group bacterium]